MSSTSAPFGLRPANHPSGAVRTERMTIGTGYASTIYQNQPVKISAAEDSSEGTIVVAAAGDTFIGTFQGVEWTDSDGRRRFSNKWTASTAGTDIVCYVTIDPTIVYEIQSNAALTIDMIGSQFDFSAAAGDTTTGFSSQTLDVSSRVDTAGAGTAGVRLIGITPGADNAWGDTYVVARVQIVEHQNTATKNAY